MRSPDVAADGRVAFRLSAPNARAVTVLIEDDTPRAMTRGARGEWTLTTERIEPDYYGYSFAVDGVRTLDVANPAIVPNLLQPRSLLHVPGDASLPWESSGSPAGVVHRHRFASAIVGVEEEVYVYTPAGYEAAASTTYPVLYLLHGFSDDASAWTAVGRAHVMLDNLIARGRATPMLVVMPLGYGLPRILQMPVRDDASYVGNATRFTEMLFAEIVPNVERWYRVAGGRRSQAIAGLSMGGFEALHAGLRHADRFSAVGAFSAGLRDGFPAIFGSLADVAALDPLWIACGTRDPLLAVNQRFRDWLAAAGIAPTNVDRPGAHTWPLWRRNFAAFVPLLFR